MPSSKLFVYALVPAALAALAPAGRAEGMRENARELFQIGVQYKIRGENKEAIQAFSMAIENGMVVPGVFEARGMSCIAQIIESDRDRRAGLAAQDLSKAIARNDSNPLLYAARGFSRAVMGDKGGIADLQMVSRLGAVLPPLGYAGLGLYAEQDDSFQDAARFFKKAYDGSTPSSSMRGWIERKMFRLRMSSRRKFFPNRGRSERWNLEQNFGSSPVVSDDAIDESVNRQWLSLLVDGEPEQRVAAARALGISGNDEAVPWLIEAINDAKFSMRARVIASLGKIGNKKAVGPISACLNDDDPRIRFLAVRALGDIASRRGRGPLDALLRKEPDKRVRAAIARSLTNIEDAIFSMKMDLDVMME